MGSPAPNGNAFRYSRLTVFPFSFHLEWSLRRLRPRLANSPQVPGATRTSFREFPIPSLHGGSCTCLSGLMSKDNASIQENMEHFTCVGQRRLTCNPSRMLLNWSDWYEEFPGFFCPCEPVLADQRVSRNPLIPIFFCFCSGPLRD